MVKDLVPDPFRDGIQGLLQNAKELFVLFWYRHGELKTVRGLPGDFEVGDP